MTPSKVKQGTEVIARNGAVGHTTGVAWRCERRHCTGVRIEVEWPGEKFTRPCSNEMRFVPAHWRQVG